MAKSRLIRAAGSVLFSLRGCTLMASRLKPKLGDTV